MLRRILVGSAVLLPFAALSAQAPPQRYEVKFHEPKTEFVAVALPVDLTPRIQIQAVGNMCYGIQVPNRGLLCCGAGAIRTSFKIDDRPMYPAVGGYSRLAPERPGQVREAYQVVWNHDGLVITQTLELVPSRPQPGQAKRQLDACMVRYVIENKSGRARKAGVRVRIDAYCGNNDGPLFAAPAHYKDKILDGVDLKGKDLPEVVQILERPDLKNPGLVGHFLTKMPGRAIGPNRFIATSHGAGEDGWEVQVIRTGGGDTDCVLYFDPREIPNGGKIEYAYAYGTGVATLPEAEGRIRLALSGSFEPGKVFSLMAFVEDPIAGQTLALDLPPGMRRLEGKEIQPVPEPAAGTANSAVLWKGTVLKAGDYQLRLRSSNGATLTRNVSIRPAQ